MPKQKVTKIRGGDLRIERTTSLGNTLRVRVTPEGGGMYRIVRFRRRPRGATRYRTVDDEAGRRVSAAHLGLS